MRKKKNAGEGELKVESSAKMPGEKAGRMG